VATPLPDPIKLLGVTDADIRALALKDGKLLAPLLLAAAGGDEAARSALYEWAYAYLEPRFTMYQSWATELGMDNYSTARLAAVGTDGFVPIVFNRGAGVDSFVGWMLSQFNPKLARDIAAPATRTEPRRAPRVGKATTAEVAAWITDAMQQGAALRTMGAYNDTMQGNSLRDALSVGWIRVAEPGACAFCLMLASRGAYGILYRTKQTANFRAHTRGKRGGGECRCHALAAWEAAGKVRKLGAMPDYAKDSEFAPYVADAAVFLDANGARGLIAA
jgi:hypothetical protein